MSVSTAPARRPSCGSSAPSARRLLKLVQPRRNPRRHIHLWPSPRRYIYLLISIAYHRHYGRAVTISWNRIIVPYHGRPDDRPWFTNGFGFLRMRCGTVRPQVKHQGRSESYGHYLHASASFRGAEGDD